MLIGFDQMKEVHEVGSKGGEGDNHLRIFADDFCRIVRGRLAAGAYVGLHTHEKDSEMIYILSGHGKILYQGEYLPLQPGDCHYCPMGHAHSLINDSDADLTFFAVVPELNA